MSSQNVVARKKLIEVALPLDAINAASAREKSIRHGHPSTLHLWWARRPLAAARAVIFSQMVDDPSTYVDTLLRDPALKRRAERELKDRQLLWKNRSEAYATAQAAGDTTVHSPGEPPTVAGCAADLERERLFDIIRELVKWENTTNEPVLQAARDEIWQSWRRACADNADHPRAAELFRRDKLPAFHDPFAGGGALPLEAQRLGLEAHASDLNPVAVLINKAMIEIPPRFAGRPPVNPEARKGVTHGGSWRGAQGLAEDVRYYGQWMRDEAEKRIGHLYPKVEVTAEMVKARPDLKSYLGRKLTVIAWLWARTVKSPNPAFADVDVPLASTFLLSTKAGREMYVEPLIEDGRYRFTVKAGKPKDAAAAKAGTKLARGANFRCLMSGAPIASSHIYSEANAGRMGARLMTIVAEGDRGRVYLAPTPEQEGVARDARPGWRPEVEMPANPRWFSPPLYGLKTYGDLFTPRQLMALTTFSDLVSEAMERVRRHAISAGLADDGRALVDDGSGALGYSEAVATYLGFGSSRASDAWSSVVTWRNQVDATRSTFARQALPMTWDYAEVNPFSESCGHWMGNSVEWVEKSLLHLPSGVPHGRAVQGDAAKQVLSDGKVVSTDPPYYDNIGYADLSDFFYVWLRRSLRSVYPDLFGTLAVPKAEELVATPYRHGGREKAESFFLGGMTQAMHGLAVHAHAGFPVTIYYAFKQSENETDLGSASTGWETFLDAVIRAGFGVSGTWPMRTEKQGRVTSNETNALASSIILVCRPRLANAPTVTRREFLAALKAELPAALIHLQRGNIAPVDLAQAAIGPGMAVFTRFAKVMDAEGKAMPVREALALINQTMDEALAEQEGDFDADSRWAITWFDENGFAEGEYGRAEQLSKSKNTSVEGMKQAGILASARSKVRLLKPDELPADWDPATDPRQSAWETVHHLVRALESGGEGEAARLVAKLGVRAEPARELAYRLYQLCERKKRSAEALSYNALVQSWPEISRLAQEGEFAASVADTPASAADLFEDR
jgi:putative DNA methylase